MRRVSDETWPPMGSRWDGTMPTMSDVQRFEGPNGPVGYSVVGEGVALFLVGGLGSTGRIWGDFPAILGRRFRVVTPDNRGVGGSRGGAPFGLAVQAEDLAALAAHLGIGSAAFLGASLGGPIVLETARRFPALVERMVLVSCAANLSAHGRTLMGLLDALLAQIEPELFGRLLTALSFAPPFHERHPALVEQVAALYGLNPADVEGTHAQVRHLLAGWDLRPHLAGIGIPALALAGERDPVVAAEETEALAAALPRARFRRFPDAAHSVLAEGGEEALGEVLAFLAEDDAASEGT
ncbi:MAG TPA: alpha/beta fold hydrolase [Acidobacteria bacterium]|nr:alpha/beta fold hydrolase [Acidobacteriota bacterium]